MFWSGWLWNKLNSTGKKTAHKLFNYWNLQFYYTVGRWSVKIKVKVETNRRKGARTQTSNDLYKPRKRIFVRNWCRKKNAWFLAKSKQNTKRHNQIGQNGRLLCDTKLGQSALFNVNVHFVPEKHENRVRLNERIQVVKASLQTNRNIKV